MENYPLSCTSARLSAPVFLIFFGLLSRSLADETRVVNPYDLPAESLSAQSLSAEMEVTPILSSKFRFSPIADGAFELENPSGRIRTFGNLSDESNQVKVDQDNSSPDQNVYLKLDKNPGGPAANYDYGRHFLFQGHEIRGDLAYITRINLDVMDPQHKITLLTPVDPQTGKTNFNNLDGSTYNPSTRKILYTEELDDKHNQIGAGRVIELTPEWPSQTETLERQLGYGGFEGIHVDNTGALYLQEDVKGKPALKPVARIDDRDVALDKALQPNSFVYRYVPTNPVRLQDGGKMQALQVHIDGRPLTFHANDPDSDIIAEAQKKLHAPGSRWPFRWVTIREIPPQGALPYNATQAARDAGATPFNRPENMAWLPGSDFRTFFFSETGNTQMEPGMLPELATRGAWGAIFRIDQEQNRQDGFDGFLSVFVLGDAAHAGFDNMVFAGPTHLLVAEDRNDALHTQLKFYDSVWNYDIATRESARLIALGVDRFCCGIKSKDNEPTGLTISNGSTDIKDMIGTLENLSNSRFFITVQHGKNRVFEILPK